MFDASSYCIAVFGVPLGYFGDGPGASPSTEDERLDRPETGPVNDPWADVKVGA